MAAGTERKRKRVAPVPVEEADANAFQTADEAASIGHPQCDGPWAKDPLGNWQLSTSETDASLVRGVHKGQLRWERLVGGGSPVEHLAVGGGFAAVALEQEIHLLDLSSGSPVLPPMLVEASVLRLHVVQEHLAVVLGDGTLRVWDLARLCSVVCTCLRGHCLPADVATLDVKPSGEPLVGLRDGRLLLYHNGLGRWLALSAPSALEKSTSSELHGLADMPRLEGDVLAAAHLGNMTELRERLAVLVTVGASKDLTRVRGCIMALLRTFGALDSMAVPQSQSLAASFCSTRGLDGARIVAEVVIPLLAALPCGQELRAELEAMLSARCHRSASLFAASNC